MSGTESKAKCSYCGKGRDFSELKQGEIIYIGRDYRGKRAVMKKTGNYCADGPCHSYDQMAHEG